MNRRKYEEIVAAVRVRSDIPLTLYGESDPKLIRAAYAIAMLHDRRQPSFLDFEAAAVTFATIGYLQC